MIFLPTTSTDVEQLMSWFTSEQQLAQWAGPDFRYPYNKQSFIEDCNIKQLASYSLLNDNNETLLLSRNHKKYLKSYYEFPGGKVENGEDFYLFIREKSNV